MSFKITNSYLKKIIFLLFLIFIVNYFDRSAIAYAIAPIKDEFHLNNMQFGLIGSAFGFGYLVMTLAGGFLVDRFLARKTLTIFALFWSMVCIAVGFATGFWSLFILRILLGVAEGPSFPSLTQVMERWLPLSARVRGTAIALAAVPFASVLGAPVISHLIIVFNWRLTFIILGSCGIILSFFWYSLYRDYPQKENNQKNITNQLHLSQWKLLLTNPSLLANNYGYFTYGYLFFFALTWLPGYLEQDYGLHLRQIGWFLIMPWALATVMLLAGGFFSDWLLAKTQSLRIARSHVIWICQLLSAFCFFIVVVHHNLTFALIFISLGLGFSLMPNAIFYSLNMDLAKNRAATSLGIMNCFFALGGIIAPALTGWLAHVTGDFNAAILLLIILTMSSVLGIIFFQHPDSSFRSN